MTTSDRIAALKAQARALAAQEKAEAVLQAAKAAYKDDPGDPKKRAAYRSAADALVRRRQAARQVAVVDTAPGNATVVPATVNRGR